MQEEFLHYLWQLGNFDINELQTTEGLPITILKRGTLNHNAGPDFLNAKIKIGRLHWEGNIEIHLKASEWREHKHHLDEAYNNVILHVVLEKDEEIYTAGGNRIPTLELKTRIPAGILGRYKALSASLKEIPCQKQLPKLEPCRITQWLERLAVQRLQTKSNRILSHYRALDTNWEHTIFYLWCKYLGGKVNTAAYKQLAERVDIKVLWKNKPFIQQLEAYLFGMAGLLPAHCKDVYPTLLKKEFNYLKKKWELRPMKSVQWRFFRMRPSNFPTVRIAQLAKLYHDKGRWLPWILDAPINELKSALKIKPSAYWDKHYLFDKYSKNALTRVGDQQFQKLLINVVIPFRFAFARHQGNERQQLAALDLLSELPSEKNQIIRLWEKKGIHARSALDSQALLELKTNWCQEKKCLQCAFGNYFLKSRDQADRVEEAFVTLLPK